MSNEQHLAEQLEKKGLYAGNIILELVPDSKGVKPSIKVNNLATVKEMEISLQNFSYLCENVHKILRESNLPITYEQAIEEAKEKVKKPKSE